MTKKLILQHLLESNIVTPTERDEVLQLFTPDVSTAVSVTIVNAFSVDGSQPVFPTPFAIDWVIQCIGHCLSISTNYLSSIYQAMSIVRSWLNSDTVFPDKKTWNIYTRQLLMYLSQVFEYKHDGNGGIERIQAINLLMDDIDKYHVDFVDKLEDETRDLIVRILVGACDYLAMDNGREELHQKPGTPQTLLRKLWLLIYKIICDSKLTGTTIWSVFFEYCGHWKSMKAFIDTWCIKIYELYSKLLDELFAGEARDEAKLKLLGFHLHQFINAIDLDTVMHNSELFYELAQLVKSLYKVSLALSMRGDSLHRPLFPASVFFSLFGNWCFKPFTVEYSRGHASLIKTLLRIGSNFDIDPKWSKVLVATVLGVLRSNHEPTLIAVMMKGHTFMCKYNSREMITAYAEVMEKIPVDDSTKMQFWKSYAGMWYGISESAELETAQLPKFLEKSCNVKAKLSMLFITMCNNFRVFVEQVVAMCASAVKISGTNTIYENMNGSDYTLVDILTEVCVMIASAPSFIEMADTNVMLYSLLECAIANARHVEFIESFMIAVASLSKWDDFVFEKKFICTFIDFLIDLQKHFGMDMGHIMRLIHGRPMNRNLTTYDTSKPIVSFMSGKDSLITLYGDEKREDTFIVHVRDSRGFFVWEINDVQLEETRVLAGEPTALPERIPYPVSEIGKDWPSEHKNFEESMQTVNNSTCADDAYITPSEHFNESHILVHKMQAIDKMSDEEVMAQPWLNYRIRHKSVDFVLQSGLYQKARKINGDINAVIDGFDAIEESSRIQIPLVHLVEDGLAKENTPLFSRFVSLLGTKNSASNPEVYMRLITFEFSKEFGYDKLVTIIFDESPLHLVKRHSDIRRSDLTIYVTPIDQKFYKISSICKDAAFWSSINHETIVSNDNLSMRLCSTLFAWVRKQKSEVFFEKDQERELFLRQIETEPVSMLSIANGYTLDCFKQTL